MTATMLEPEPLVGPVVRLDPMTTRDAGGLFDCLDDHRVWDGGYGGGPAGRPADAAAMRKGLIASGIAGQESRTRLAYVVRLAADSALGESGTIVGTSSLGDFDLANEHLHLGWTAYGPPWWSTAVNPAAKLLLLDRAFDHGFGRVKLQTDNVNARSQAAIARLGAVREGVLRRHKKRADGSFRDTVVYSILASEWPTVRGRIAERVGAMVE